MHEAAATPREVHRPPSARVTPRQAFTTAGLAASQTLDAWRHYLGEVYFKLHIDPGPHDAIDGSLVKRGFDQLQVSGFHSGSQRISRSKRLALTDNVEIFCLVFPTLGRFTYRQHGREATATGGDAYVLNASEAHEVDVGHGSGLVCLAVPCALLRERIRGVDDLCGAGGFTDPVIASTLRHLVMQVLAEEPGTDAARLQDLCLDMIDLMIRPGTRRWSRSEAVVSDLVRKVGQVIAERYVDSSFDLAAAARACGVSPRRLQEALRLRDMTFSRELIVARLQAASRMLRSSFDAGRQIGEVAAACGFVSQAHFATRYREHFGRSPSDERRGNDMGFGIASGKQSCACRQDGRVAVG